MTQSRQQVSEEFREGHVRSSTWKNRPKNNLAEDLIKMKKNHTIFNFVGPEVKMLL
jgi:hypothetical protein